MGRWSACDTTLSAEKTSTYVFELRNVGSLVVDKRGIHLHESCLNQVLHLWNSSVSRLSFPQNLGKTHP